MGGMAFVLLAARKWVHGVPGARFVSRLFSVGLSIETLFTSHHTRVQALGKDIFLLESRHNTYRFDFASFLAVETIVII
jgi:hypothetical protein